MALIKCPDCGKDFSDRAPACPDCGCPTEEAMNHNSSPDSAETEEELHFIPENMLKVNHGLRIGFSDSIIEVYDSKMFSVLKDNAANYMVLWEERKTMFGKESIDIVFAHEGFPKTMQISVVQNSPNYQIALLFYEQLVPQMIQRIQKNLFSACAFRPPAKIKCSVCGCEDIDISMVATSEVQQGRSEVRKKSAITRAGNKAGRAGAILATGGLWALMPKRSDYSETRKNNTRIINSKVAICKKCGNSWKI